MLFQGRLFYPNTPRLKNSMESFVLNTTLHTALFTLLLSSFFILNSGCVSDQTNQTDTLIEYQQTIAQKGPQKRIDTTGNDLTDPLGLLKPIPSTETNLPELNVTIDPNTDKRTFALSIEQALARSLVNSPEITIVSFDPMISKQEITKAASEFDITAFGSVNYEDEDNPQNSLYQAGQSNTRAFESGIMQKTTTGSEWSLSYTLTRGWDDLSVRPLSTSYEPIVGFQFKQPLLRNAWYETNIANVDIAKLNYRISLYAFRQKAEEIATEVITAYWLLYKAQHDYRIYQTLLDNTLETLAKVEGRAEIDATEVHISQTRAAVKSREAVLLQAYKQLIDAQDNLIRLMSDTQLNVLDDISIEPISEPVTQAQELELLELLETALNKNPVIQQAKLEIEIAEINNRIAQRQEMPKLDLITSARTQSLARGPENAHDKLTNGDYVSYGIGLSLEYPLGNRQREAELIQRKYEYRKAVSVLQNISDEAEILTRENIRKVQMNFDQIEILRENVEASQTHLEVLEDTETIREQLTPEFLQVKLQAQETLANAQMEQVRAVVDFNIALAELARTLGTVLEMQQVAGSLPVDTNLQDETEQQEVIIEVID